jgi:hypothetical protein
MNSANEQLRVVYTEVDTHFARLFRKSRSKYVTGTSRRPISSEWKCGEQQGLLAQNLDRSHCFCSSSGTKSCCPTGVTATSRPAPYRNPPYATGASTAGRPMRSPCGRAAAVDEHVALFTGCSPCAAISPPTSSFPHHHPPPRAKLRPTRSLARRSLSLSTGGSSTSNSTSSAMSQ